MALAAPVLVGVAWLVLACRIGILGTQVETLLSWGTVAMKTEYGRRLLLETVTTRLPSALGVYNFPIMVLGAWYLLRRRSLSDVVAMLWIVIVSLLLMVTLPDHRYFVPAFPSIALVMAQGIAQVSEVRERTVVLSLLSCVGALYLFVDWERSSHLFLPGPG